MVAVDEKLILRRKRTIACAVNAFRAGQRRDIQSPINFETLRLRGKDRNTTAIVGYNATTQTWGVIQRYVYSPYGNIQILNSDWSVTPTGTQPIIGYLYQGMTLDAVTGLYYALKSSKMPAIARSTFWTSSGHTLNDSVATPTSSAGW